MLLDEMLIYTYHFHIHAIATLNDTVKGVKVGTYMDVFLFVFVLFSPIPQIGRVPI